MIAEDFSQRLHLALKALSISSGQLASDLGVDKSVVNRWLRGVSGPTGNNLSRLTALIGARRPGFTMLDWEAEPLQLAAKLGIGEVPSATPSEVAPGPPIDTDLGGLIPPRVIQEALAISAFRGSAYEGFWRVTRPSIEAPGQFMRDYVIMRMGAHGLLTSRIGVEDMGFQGVAFPNHTQLFGFVADAETGIFIFSIFNAVLRHRADVLDGITLTCRREGGGTPVASCVLMERVDVLSGDPVADDARHDAMTRANVPLVAEQEVPEDVRAHLVRDIGPSALAAGGDLLMTMAFAQSFSRGPKWDHAREVAEA